MSDIENLLLKNKEDREAIDEMEKTIALLQNTIKDRERQLFRKCKHEYVVDKNRTTSDDCKYYCKICGCWRDKFMYE